MKTLRRGRRILVLDDEKRNRGLTPAIFAPLGMELLTAPDTKRALEILGGKDIDVFVTDLQLSSISVLAAVRKRLPELPIVVMTGYTDGEGVTGTQLGSVATTILTEPLDQEDVVLAVRHVFLRQAVASGAAALNTACDTRSPRILLAEDDASSRRLLSAILGKQGCDVTCTEDGVEALAAVEVDDFDLVVTDIMMPRVDGIQLTREVKKLKPGLPVIVLSAASHVEVSLDALRAGAFCYITKPVNATELQLAVERAVFTSRLQEELWEQNSLLEKRTENLERALREIRQQGGLYAASRLSMLKRVSANVAHELKNPLNSINASFTYVRGRISQEAFAANPKLSKHSDIIEAQIQRSGVIIAGIMDFANPDAVPVAEIQIGGLLRESLRLGLPVETEIEVRLELSETLPPVAASERKLKGLFVNLISNAARAMKNSGILAIKAETDGAGNARVIVADTGPGIPAGIIHKVFDPFFTTDQTQGTGLGLAICRETIQQLGGEISAANAPNGGAVLTVTLPRAQHAEVSAEAAALAGGA